MLDVVIMKHPSCLFWRATLAIPNVGFVIRRDTLLCCTTEHADNAQTNRSNGQSRAPSIVEHVETNVSVGIDVRVAWCRGKKYYLWCFHRVVRGEDEAECVAFVLIDGAGGTGNGNEPLVYAVGLFDGHARDGGVLDGPLGQLACEATLRDARELLAARARWGRAHGGGTARPIALRKATAARRDGGAQGRREKI